MKKIAMFLSSLALAFLAGCSADAATSPTGTYELDTAGFVKAMTEGAPEEQKAAMEEQLGKAKGTLELKEGGKFTMSMTMPMMPAQKVEGTWKIDGDKVTCTGKDQDGKEDTVEMTLKDGKLTATEEMGPKKIEMTFAKKG